MLAVADPLITAVPNESDRKIYPIRTGFPREKALSRKSIAKKSLFVVAGTTQGAVSSLVRQAFTPYAERLIHIRDLPVLALGLK